MLSGTAENYWTKEAPDYLINHAGLTISTTVLKDLELGQVFAPLLEKANTPDFASSEPPSSKS